MPLIHDRRECLTGMQEHKPWSPRTDLQTDFVMVYGTDAGMPERVKEYRERGYRVHLMTGCAWGDYRDWLDGEWDGVPHRSAVQTDRNGKPILHGKDTPYLCPDPSFGRYLLEKLKPAVDAGVEAVHLEEPEFWDAGGYGTEFRRAWEERYGEDWQPPHESCENHFRASALKVYLFRRLIAEVSAGLKDYARNRGREIAFYVPTHSLVNYTQWKILSPEGTLLDVPTVDGCIAQVWTGTSRAGNVYRGRYAGRTFETAFLEYGVMQELVRGTGRKMWFLHDPVEDNPEYTWENFRENYLKTVAASLMHPEVYRYEAVTWPDRVFNGIYPKHGRIGGNGLQPDRKMEGAKPIPAEYAELICTLIQTLGDMRQPDTGFLPESPRIGLLMADSGLYQRTYPDSLPHSPEGVDGLNERLFCLLDRQKAGEETDEDSRALCREIAGDPKLYLDYLASGPFPHFFGLAMPLVKAGIPLQPVQMENILRYPGYLSAYHALILSYEWMKPGDPREHDVLAAWVQEGGTLLLAGDGSDPYHQIRSWWNSDGRDYSHPGQHLCERMGLGREPAEGIFPVGAGHVAIRRISPARITLTAEAAEDWLRWVLSAAMPDFRPRNAFVMKRGPYRIAVVMEESVSREPLVLRGRFADLLSPVYEITEEKLIPPGGMALLYDLSGQENNPVLPIASTARIENLTKTETGYRIACKTAEGIRIRMRLRLPNAPETAEARDGEGVPVRPEIRIWDASTRTLLLGFAAGPRQLDIQLATENRAEGEKHG